MVGTDISVSWRGGLEALVKELDRQKKHKVDFLCDSRDVRFVAKSDHIGIEPATPAASEFITERNLRLSDRALGQLGERVSPNIPSKFITTLAASQPLIASSLLSQMTAATPSRVLFRCLDGRVRAALSSKYRVFDDYDIAFQTLDVIRNNNGTVLDCSISESRFDIRFTATHIRDRIDETRGGLGNPKHIARTTMDPSQFKNLPPGTVCPFVRVSHSGVGEGGLNIGFGVLRLACVNGLVTESSMNQIHLGASLPVGLLTDEAIQADSKAIMLKARDLIQSSLHPSNFHRVVKAAKDCAADTISSPSTAVSNLVENEELTDKDRDGILEYFLRDYDSNRWGLSQAVARYAQDLDDPSDAADIENIAGRLVLSGSAIV